MDVQIVEALFQQLRLQIMHLGIHHNKFTDAYLYAWSEGVYPYFEDTDGSVLKMPHETFPDSFLITKECIEELFIFLRKKWDDKSVPTFYELEDTYLSIFDRDVLVNVCRYIYLQRNTFDEDFWVRLIAPMEHPSEAQYVVSVFDREDTCFM